MKNLRYLTEILYIYLYIWDNYEVSCYLRYL